MKLLTKSIISLSLALLITLTLSGWIGMQNEHHILNELLENHGKSISHSVAVSCVEILLSEDYPVLDTFLETFGKESDDILFLEVVHQGKVVSKYSFSQMGIFNPIIFNSDILFSISDDNSSEKIGEVRLGLSDRTRNLLLTAQLWEFIIMFVSTFIVLVLIQTLLINLIIIRPIRKLIEGMHKVSKGELSDRVKIGSGDEIGVLATSFNKMTENLYKTTVSKEYVNNIIKTMTDALIVVKPDGIIETVNRAALDLLGYTENELIGRPIVIIFAEEKLMFDDTGIDGLIKKGFTLNVEKICLSKDGRNIPVIFSSSVMYDTNKDIRGIVCIAQDITEQKMLEREKGEMMAKMVATSKLASLGEIATGIAHEINQPLTYISTFIQNLQEDIEDNTIDESKLEDRLKTVANQSERINKIIQHLRSFSRQDIVDMYPVSIEVVFNNTLLLMGERIRLSNIDLVKNIEPDLPMVSGNSSRLEGVFINLFQNSIDAFTDNSKNARIGVNTSLSEDKESVIIKVIDNGVGIEYEKQERIFEPFFTTKEIGKGTGLGLSIIYGIVQEHKGTITCQSEISKGTTFTITLPVA